MFIIFSFVILVFEIIYSKIHEEMNSPLAIFAYIWLTILTLYSMKLFGIYDISYKTTVVLFLGFVGMFCGYAFCRLVKIKQYDYSLVRKPHYERLTILAGMVILLSSSFYIANINLVFGGLMVDELKAQMVTGEIGWGGVWMQYFVRPLEYIVVAVSCYCLVIERKQKLLILSGIILTLFEFVGTASKTSLAYYAICVFAAFVYNRSSMLRIRKTAKIYSIIIIGVIAIYLLVKMGFERIYMYLCGCIPMLDHVVNETFYTEYGFSYGFLSYNSLVRLIIKTFQFFGYEIKSKLFEIANSYFLRFEYTTKVSTNGNYNAFHTLFGDFYVDFGCLGVFLFSFVFGIFICYYYKRYRKTASLDIFIMLCLIMYYILLSMVRFQMSNTFLGLMVIYGMLFLKTFIYKDFFLSRDKKG